MLVPQFLLLLSLAYLLKCLLRVCSELDTLLFSAWRWEYGSDKIKTTNKTLAFLVFIFTWGETNNKQTNGDNCYGRISSREERRGEGCGSYNYKQGLPQKKDLKKEESMQISGRKSILWWGNSKCKGPEGGVHLDASGASRLCGLEK